MIPTKNIRRSIFFKPLALSLATLFLYPAVFPTLGWATSDGPGQMENTRASVGTPEVVDLFTGDFSYSIPLLEMGGRPLVLNYNANITGEQDAGWVGLGWSLNPGSINREMRGLPDDFRADRDTIKEVEKVALTTIDFEGFGTMKNISGTAGVGVGLNVKNSSLMANGSFSRNTMNYSGLYVHNRLGNDMQRVWQIGHSGGPNVSGKLFGLGLSTGLTYFSGNRVVSNPLIGNSYQYWSGETAYGGLDYSLGSKYVPYISGNLGVGLSRTKSENRVSHSRGGYGGITKTNSVDLSFNAGASLSYTRGEIVEATKTVSTSLAGYGFSKVMSSHSSWEGFSKAVSVPRARHSRIGTDSTEAYQYTKNNLGASVSIYYFGAIVSAGVNYQKDAVENFQNGDEGLVGDDATHASHLNQGANGYFYTTSSEARAEHLNDFVRDKDGPISFNHSRFLPVPILSYDMFHASAMGDGFTFRAHKYRPENTLEPNSIYKVNAAGNSIVENDDMDTKSDGDGTQYSQNKSWSGNEASKHFHGVKDSILQQAQQNKYCDTEIEEFYFRSTDELSVFDRDYYSQFVSFGRLGHHDPVFSGSEITTSNLYRMNSWRTQEYPDTIVQQNRIHRNRYVQYKQAESASTVGIESSIKNWDLYSTSIPTSGQTNNTEIQRDTTNFNSNHINEFEVTNADGSRYVYGIPVYNLEQSDYSFSIDPTNVNQENGLCQYVSGDNTVANNRGDDQYFSSRTIPKYATSFLLTEILSDNYQDLTGNGPSFDDPGDFIRINYSKVHSDFHWRSPMAYIPASGSATTSRAAYYNPGLLSDDEDDKASYSYGTKEIWYVHSIETKDLIAEFYLSDRNDGLGALNADGQLDTSKKLKKLDRIEVYNKVDRTKNGADARLLEKVTFEYDYSLCKGIINTTSSGDGKLTLKKVFITAGESERGSHSPYEFFYNDDHNYDYEYGSTDGWGRYKPLSFDGPYNGDYPFAVQNADSANAFASAWKMDSLHIPGGASMKIEYESDDYGYVQDKQAMRMQRIVGTSGATLGTTWAPLYSYNKENNNTTAYNRIYIELDRPIVANSDNNAKYELFRTYLKGLIDSQFVYTRCMLDYRSGYQEPMECFVSIKDYGVEPAVNGQYSTVWIDLESMEEHLKNISEKQGEDIYLYDKRQTNLNFPKFYNLSPLVHYGWDHARKRMNKYLFQMTGLHEELKILNTGMARRGAAIELNTNESWIRLYAPEKTKRGGGHRVKSVRYYDNWGAMGTQAETSVYGQEYTYVDPLDTNRSSGVASFESGLLGIENPIRQPVWAKVESNWMYTEDKKSPIMDPLVEDHVLLYHWYLTPQQDAYFPAAQVGYSSVQVKDLDYEDVTVNVKGKLLSQFYTTKDFPTEYEETRLRRILTHQRFDTEAKEARSSKNSEQKNKYKYGLSQGYKVIKYNMHGKPRANYLYDAANANRSFNSAAPVTSAVYHYKPINQPGMDPLEQRVKLIRNDGSIVEKDVGVSINLVSDSYTSLGLSENTTETTKWFQLEILSRIYRLFGTRSAKNEKINKGRKFTTYTEQLTEINVAVLLQEIERQGILVGVEYHGPNTEHYNDTWAYDYLTLNPLVTASRNEFNDEVFQVQYPAHWAYDDLDLASKRGNLKYEVAFVNSTNCVLGTSDHQLRPGDEVEVNLILGVDEGRYHYWVLEDETDSTVVLIDRQGNIPNLFGTGTLTVIRPVNTNQAGAPITQITTLDNPVSGSTLSLTNVLAASASRYVDGRQVNGNLNPKNWGSYNCCSSGECNHEKRTEPSGCLNIGDTLNPFVQNLSKYWHGLSGYAYRTERKENDVFASINTQTAGTYTQFVPFWEYDSNEGHMVSIFESAHDSYDPNGENWTLTEEYTLSDPFGHLLETRNTLGHYSAAIFGYNVNQVPRVPVAEAANARYHQILNESFEGWDYGDYSLCHQVDHSGFSQLIDQSFRTDTFAHTGDYSLMICPEGNHFLEYFTEPLTQSGSSDLNFLDTSEILPIFSPNQGRYWFSAWVANAEGAYHDSLSDQLIQDTSSSLSVKIDQYDTFGTLQASDSIFASGALIEGWQKLEGSFRIEATTKSIRFTYRNLGENTGFIDDIRIHPYHAQMETQVYDNENLRLIATLDQDNFATFFHYDQEGNQISANRETIDGILTISETRSFKHKQ